MKISLILTLLTLSTVVKGWAAILQPVLFSIGAALAALNIDTELISNIQPFTWKSEATEVKTRRKLPEKVTDELLKKESAKVIETL